MQSNGTPVAAASHDVHMAHRLLRTTKSMFCRRLLSIAEFLQDVELVQFMGKDNVPFHTVIFPATLLGTGQPWTMMRSISVTEYLNYEGTQFSKSRGTGALRSLSLIDGRGCPLAVNTIQTVVACSMFAVNIHRGLRQRYHRH